MPIENVNAAAGAYQASSAEAQNTQQAPPEDTQNSASIAKTADTVEISPTTDRLKAKYGVENAGAEREDDMSAVYPGQAQGEGGVPEAHGALTGLADGAVQNEESVQGAAEQGVVENRSEQLRERQQTEETAAKEPDTTNQNRRLDLTV